jgi:hypothetical protein
MSSNYPYGGRQRPMPGQGPDTGSGPAQQQPPYGYPQPPAAGYPERPVVDSPTAPGYSFGPFAPEEQGGWPGGPQADPYSDPSGRYGRAQMPPTPPTDRGPSNSGKILIIVGAAALAVILIAVIAVVVATSGRPATNPQGGQGTAGQQTKPSQGGGAPQATSRPSDAVAAYLQAVAAGDATTALSYAADPAPTGPLLTNKVLAAALKRAPLTGIDVPVNEDQKAKSVSASYTLGSSDVSESFDVVKVGDMWKIGRAVKDLDISFIMNGSVPVKINGVKVTDESVAVLPGSYAFTSGLPYVSYGSKDVVLVKSPYAEADTYQVQSQLTKSGKRAAISATKKSFKKCLQRHSLDPSNCPQQKFKSKYNYKKSTITWRRAGSDPFRKPTVSFSGTQARIEIPIDLKLSGSCTYKGRSGNCSGSLTGKSVAVVKVTSKPLKVKWL